MSGATKTLQEPASGRQLTTREKIILLESSKLHGSVFPPWENRPESAEFDLPTGEADYVDNVNFPMSALQAELFNGWQRPRELRKSRDMQWEKPDTPRKALDLVQDVITDCSVVASLCAVTARTERGNPDLWKTSMYPYDCAIQQLAASGNGKYMFRFHFNGCYRKVIIDDRLPSSRTSRTLHVVDRNNADTYWPALIEKAYLKVRGGYDFPGSNSGTDLWILTGWIPEQLFLQSDDIDRDVLWQRLLKAFSYGDVLITIGTGKLTQSEERVLGLVAEHDYSVIDVKEAMSQHLFLVKNPWSNGQVWKGHIRFQRSATCIDEKMQDLELQNEGLPGSSSPERLSPGTFWMPLNDIFQNFESIYLNWNPGLFSCREDVHFKWDISEPSGTDGCFGSNPQYCVRTKSAGAVWLLLSRHFTSSRVNGSAENDPGFISLYAFNNGGQRVVLSDGAVARSPYVDSPNALLKVDLALDQALTIVVSEQTLPHIMTSFSLSAFSFAPLELALAGNKYAFNFVEHGAWTAATSGGNVGSPHYHENPQFSIDLGQLSNISLLLRTKENWPVQVTMVWANGKQVQSVTTRDVVGDSGEYRKGCAFAEIQNVQAGTYTIVCSTFEQDQRGSFELSVSATTACRLRRVAVAAAGRFVTQLQNIVWTPEVDRLMAPLVTRRLNNISVSAKSFEPLRTTDKQYCSPLKISIEQGRGPTIRAIAISGQDRFGDARHVGVHTPDIDILPEMCARGLRIALDRLGSSRIPNDESVEVQILSDGPIEVGAWVAGDHCG